VPFSPRPQEYSDSSDESESRFTKVNREPSIQLQPRTQEPRSINAIQASSFVYPKSQYQGHVPPLPISRERDVIQEYLEDLQKQREGSPDLIPDQKGDEFLELELSEFSIYLPGTTMYHGLEMRGLQDLATRTANSCYCFDGVLSWGKSKAYVQNVFFDICSIGRYGKEFDSIGDQIWIQSKHNHRKDVYYRLKTPSIEYERFHEAFLWLANLAKHFVDYLQDSTEQYNKISIFHFRSDFARWLRETHHNSLVFCRWYKEHNSEDFRCAVAANIEFLWKEYVGTKPKRLKHPLWSEVKDMSLIPAQPREQKNTIVTPYVYDSFKHMIFGSQLEKVAPIGEVDIRRKSQGEGLHLTVDGGLQDAAELSLETHDSMIAEQRHAANHEILQRNFDRGSIKVGDVLGVTKDPESEWKDEVSKWKSTDDFWLVLVQDIARDKKGQRTFGIIWVYRPSDTTCAKMKYPYHDELFLSDNCNCHTKRISEEEILCRATVDWHGQPGNFKSDFFIRQTFQSVGHSFVTLEENHKQCTHLLSDKSLDVQEFREAVEKYRVGDTVLVNPPARLKRGHGLEPVEIVNFLNDEGSRLICVKRLLRRLDVNKSSQTRPNELVYTEETFKVKAHKVVRKCIVRFYTEDELEKREIPAPYNRDGTCDAFYITTRLLESDDHQSQVANLQPIQINPPQSLIQGFDPRQPAPRPRLRGLDLYCGGGSFGRGLEEGGAIQMTHAVDVNCNALHTYYANLDEPDSTKLFYGSVDDVLYQALHNNPRTSDLIPFPGQIEFLSAGSPCQGYSRLNPVHTRFNERGLKNQSLIASVAAYVDVYRPKYALLENVATMAQKGKNRDGDVLSQLVCCLVGMGYQVQLYLLDAWSFGSPQVRTRLFVSMAAPGLKLPEHPGLSHSHPPGTGTRSLGLGANGESFGVRQFDATPFEFITAAEATRDLPDIGDGRTYHCTPYPDHRLIGFSRKETIRIGLIPRYPRLMNYAKAWKAGLMTEAERQNFPLLTAKGTPRFNASAASRAYGRIHPHKLFNTIATTLQPQDAMNGRWLHWDEQRPITVMEGRRAQSIPDCEVLTGNPNKQWKIVGNGVARTVSTALGISIRNAWLQNPPDERKPGTMELALQVDKTPNLASFSRAQPLFRTKILVEVPHAILHLGESTSDEAALSDEQYRHSLRAVTLRSSVSDDELAPSENSTPRSDPNERTNTKRQRGALGATSKVKKAKLLGPASVRDARTLWTPINGDLLSSPPPDGALFNLASEEPSSRAKKREVMRMSNESIESTNVTRNFRVVKSGQNCLPTASTPEYTSKSQRRRLEPQLPAIINHSPEPRQMKSLHIQRPATITAAPKRAILIDLSSDVEEPEEDDSGDDVKFIGSVTSTTNRAPAPYIPANNRIFAAYEQTHQMMPKSKR
jgi:DNA (cytosine-5)-methyltransferase 1